MSTHRTQIYLEQRQYEHIRDDAHARRITMAEWIRQAVDERIAREAGTRYIATLNGNGIGVGATRQEAIEHAVRTYEATIGYGDDPKFADRYALVSSLEMSEEGSHGG